jgi:glycerol uptake facilitator-like aquaporin
VINNKKTTFCFNQFTTWIIAAIGVLMSRQMSPHSGGCMNPSMALGLNLSKSITTFSLSNFQSLYIFVLSPIIGSLIGTLYFDYMYLAQYPTKYQI